MGTNNEFILPDDMFKDEPVFVDTSHEFDDDCGDACKIQDTLTQTTTCTKQHMIMNTWSGKKKNDR